MKARGQGSLGGRRKLQGSAHQVQGGSGRDRSSSQLQRWKGFWRRALQQPSTCAGFPGRCEDCGLKEPPALAVCGSGVTRRGVPTVMRAPPSHMACNSPWQEWDQGRPWPSSWYLSPGLSGLSRGLFVSGNAVDADLSRPGAAQVSASLPPLPELCHRSESHSSLLPLQLQALLPLHHPGRSLALSTRTSPCLSTQP